MISPEARTYYASPGPLTSLAAHAERISDLPNNLDGLVRVVQGLIVHPAHAGLYGLDPGALRNDELQQRAADEMLATVLEHDGRPLDVARAPEQRFCGNCRHFATLLTALLRHQGVPARARCGFGAYFEPDRYADHWVCEVWDDERDAWHLVDAQIDDLQREKMSIRFDTTDVSREQFWVAGQAWQRCRRGEVDPKQFGIFDMWGLWFVRGNVLRDLAALRKLELLPWDGWGVMEDPDEGPAFEAAFPLIDRAAEVTTSPEAGLEDLRGVYEEPGLRVPRKIKVYSPDLGEVELPI